MRGVNTHRRRPRLSDNPLFFWVVLAAILVVGIALRFVGLGQHPATDYDEYTYLEVGRNVAEHGVVMAKTPYGQMGELYMYNPVFYFYLLGGWFRLFGVGLYQARLLAASASVLTLFMLAVVLRRLIGNWALLAVFLLAVDGWVVFTNRVGWIENLGFVFAIWGLWLYERALAKPATPRFIVAGLMLAWATVFKYQFGYFVVAALICWMVVRKYHRGHLVLFGTIMTVFAAYIAAMFLWDGTDFRREMGGQLLRLAGAKASRGQVSSSGQFITAFENQYAIYFGMLVALAIALAVVIGRMGQVGWRFIYGWRRYQAGRYRRSEHEGVRLRRWEYIFEEVSGNALLFAWAASAAVCFCLTAKVRLPHYTFLVILPAYCYLVAEMKRYVGRAGRQIYHKWAVAVLVLIVTASGLFATYQRMVPDHRDAFAQATAWIDQNVPPGSLIITEEPLGNNTPDGVAWCKTDHAASCERAGANFLVLYSTLTFKPPDSPAIKRMTLQGRLMATFEDFKAKVVIYKITPIS